MVKTGKDINDSKVADVTDMKAGARGIREHFGEEGFGFAFFLFSFVGFGFFPDFLPFLLYF